MQYKNLERLNCLGRLDTTLNTKERADPINRQTTLWCYRDMKGTSFSAGFVPHLGTNPKITVTEKS